jgi:hypothetical protein
VSTRAKSAHRWLVAIIWALRDGIDAVPTWFWFVLWEALVVVLVVRAVS